MSFLLQLAPLIAAVAAAASTGLSISQAVKGGGGGGGRGEAPPPPATDLERQEAQVQTAARQRLLVSTRGGRRATILNLDPNLGGTTVARPTLGGQPS